MKDWNGQSLPTFKHQKGKSVSLQHALGKNVSYFMYRKYQRLREQKIAELKANSNPLDAIVKVMRPAPGPIAIPTVKDRQSADSYRQLQGIGQQVVALIDDDMCINCGKCYMACADSGYQAIAFDADIHIPRVMDDCTGCTLCMSVCPIIDCKLQMQI